MDIHRPVIKETVLVMPAQMVSGDIWTALLKLIPNLLVIREYAGQNEITREIGTGRDGFRLVEMTLASLFCYICLLVL